MKLIAMTFTLAMLTSMPAIAQIFDGNEFLKKCAPIVNSPMDTQFNSDQGVNGAYCLGFIRGAMDMNELRMQQGFKVKYCEPTVMSNDQMASIVVNFIQSRPNIRHYHASVLLTAAMASAYPCR